MFEMSAIGSVGMAFQRKGVVDARTGMNNLPNFMQVTQSTENNSDEWLEDVRRQFPPAYKTKVFE